MRDYIELTFVRLECNVSSLFPNPLFQQTNHEKNSFKQGCFKQGCLKVINPQPVAKWCYRLRMAEIWWYCIVFKIQQLLF